MVKKADKQKLATLLNYWIEHNREHSEEFLEWSERAIKMGEPKVARAIKQSVTEMSKATNLLSQALKILESNEV